MEDTLLSVKPTLVRRVSDLFRDGNNNGSQLLFNNTSMQKIRHCCQNLSLLPYLFHSFSNSKSADAYKQNLNFFINRFFEKIFSLYTNSLRQTIRSHLSVESCQKSIVSQSSTDLKCNDLQLKIITEIDKFENIKSKRSKITKNNNTINNKHLLLTLAVYLVPVVLLTQIIGIVSFILIGKNTPGFIFLFSALFVLGGVSMKIFLYKNTTSCIKHHGKRKSD